MAHNHLISDVTLAIEKYEHETGQVAHALRSLYLELVPNSRFWPSMDPVRRVTCSCGCGATKPDDGRCECGKPIGHS